MSLLEERILRIIELKEKGLEDREIAKELGLESRTIKLYEESTKKAINDLVLEGYKPEQIAKNIGLSLIAFNLVASYYNIKLLPLKRGRSMVQSIAKIKEAINNRDSIEEISKKTGLAISTIIVYARKEKIKLPEGSCGSYKPNEKRTAEIKQAIAEGVKSAQEISKRTGLAPSTVYRYVTSLGINYSLKSHPKVAVNYHKQKFKTKRDRLIRKGLGLGDISREEKVTPEAIRKYILETEQYEKWKESRKYYKKRKKPEQLKKEVISQIASAIDLIARQKLKEDEKLAYEKATEYFKLVKRSTYSFNRVFTLLKRYSDAKRDRKKLSLMELGKDSNIVFVLVGKILKKVGEEPLFGVRERKVITKEGKEALSRINKIKMNCPDISYFLGLNRWNVYAYFNKHPKKKPRTKADKYVVGFKKDKKLAYRVASEIYEAQDLGFSKKETLYLLDIPEKVFDYTNQHRTNIESKIINALKILYPKKEITKPYIDFK